MTTTTAKRNSYSRDQIALAKRMLLDATCEVRVAQGEIERISRETGVRVDMLHALTFGRAHVDVEPTPTTHEMEMTND